MKPLIEISEDTSSIINSHGVCRECKETFSAEALYFPNGHSIPKWTIVYEGFMCKKCEGIKEDDFEYKEPSKFIPRNRYE